MDSKDVVKNNNHMTLWVYILKCKDGSFYTGSHRGTDVFTRVAEHQSGKNPNSYTYKRRPVELVYTEEYSNYAEGARREHPIKGWSRKKKLALINGNNNTLPELSKRTE